MHSFRGGLGLSLSGSAHRQQSVGRMAAPWAWALAQRLLAMASSLPSWRAGKGLNRGQVGPTWGSETASARTAPCSPFFGL